MTRLSVPAALVVVLTAFIYVLGQAQNLTHAVGQPQKMTTWVAPALIRVGQADPPGSATTAQLWAAKGEAESFQVIVSAPLGGLTNVKVTVSDLHGQAGTISRTNISLYREHYVYVSKSSPDSEGTNRPLGTGWYPDALIPFVDPETGLAPQTASIRATPFDVAGFANQPVWIDVFVPSSASAGRYSGTVSVLADQGTQIVPVELTVWNFQLPLKPSLKSRFALGQPPQKHLIAELLKHRLMPEWVYTPDERTLIDTGGLSTVNLAQFWSGANTTNCTMSAPPSVAAVKAAAAAHQKDLFVYNQAADEVGNCPSLIDTIKLWGRTLHEAGLSHLLTIAPRADLYDDGSGSGRSAVDIWVVLPNMYDDARENVARVLAKGDSVWSYAALVQDGYSPKWEIDFAPINYRIFGLINQSLGLSGLLYWSVDRWTSDPWHDVQTHRNGRYDYPGEGMLVYPGHEVGMRTFAPSMRLKWLRDSVEDYEYVEILKTLGLRTWALDTIRDVAPDWSHWTREPAKLEAVRIKLGSEISATYDVDVPPLGPPDSDLRHPDSP